MTTNDKIVSNVRTKIVYLVVGLTIGIIISFIAEISYLSNLDYLIDHVSIHFQNGCIYNSEQLICSNKPFMEGTNYE